MFNDKTMIPFLLILLNVFYIILPGPIIPAIIVVAMAVEWSRIIIKLKKSPEGFQAMKKTLILIIVIMVLEIAWTAYQFSIEEDWNKKYGYLFPDKEETTSYETTNADVAILDYKTMKFEWFSDGENHKVAIKNGFIVYLKDTYGLTDKDITIDGYNITCELYGEKYTFVIEKDDIKYVAY